MEAITRRVNHIRQLSADCAQAAPPPPKSVKIELTAHCDFECSFCASHTRARRKSDMSRDFFERIVRQMRGLGVDQLGVFYLGESFLCDWLPDAIRYAKRTCGYPYVFLTTNGRLATSDRVRACMLAGLDSLKFSLNFSSPRQFHAATQLDAKEYHVVISNLKDACWIRDFIEYDTGHRCGIYASSLCYDDNQRRRMRNIVQKILPFVDEHYYLPLYGYTGLPCGDADDAARERAGALRKAPPCWSLFTEAHITSDGHLSACCFDHGSRFHMGDLNRVSFLEAWHSTQFQALRAAHLSHELCATVCAQCIAYD